MSSSAIILALRSFVVALSLPLLTACAVYDPAPYVPSLAATVDPGQTIVLQLQTTATQLQATSDSYGAQRDALMREQLLFDVPMLGLAGASVISGVFHGAATVTLGLGIGSGSFAAAKIYFSPQSRAAAYNGASLSLACAAGVALDMGVQGALANRPENAGLLSSLQTQLDITDSTNLTVAAANAQDRATLLAARTQAQKSHDGLAAALTTLTASPVQLRIFSGSVVRATTSKVVSGVQNTDAVMAALKALAPTASTGTKTPTPAPVVGGAGVAGAVVAPADDAKQARILQQLAAGADVITQAISGAWSTLASCALPSS